MRILLALSIVLTVLLSGCEKEELITNSELPSEIKNYVSTHFPNNPIIQSILDKDGFTKSYDIFLEGNFNLEFNKKKEIIQIDGVSQLPDSVIPEKIREYVIANYTKNFITDWELETKHQQVELNNTIELEFDMNGNFIRVDID